MNVTARAFHRVRAVVSNDYGTGVIIVSALVLVCLMTSVQAGGRQVRGRQRALDKVEILGLLFDDTRTTEIVRQSKTRGLTFVMDQKYSKVLRKAGAPGSLVDALRSVTG